MRNGPTLTHVPVASLKSSAIRPSNKSPLAGSTASAEFDAHRRSRRTPLRRRPPPWRRRAPIAGRDIRPPHPRFELAFVRHELEFEARERQADIADLLAFPAVRASAGGSGFGRAEARQKHDALADGLDREFLERVMHMLRQAGAGVEHQLEAAEKPLAQRPILETDAATASRSPSAR